MKQNITAVIIAKNEVDMLANCIETVRWCKEILVIDNGSTDQTAALADSLGARVVSYKTDSFAQLRSKALKHIKTDWIFYLDADERVTPELSREISVHVETADTDVMILKRDNYCYGSLLSAGGWQNDVVERVFKKTALQGWDGELHESPVYEGKAITLHHPLWHFTHRSVVSSLLKSASWTPMEAKMLAAADVPPVSFWTIWRKFGMEFLRRYIMQQGYKDGMVGLVESFTQAFNRAIVYMQVWELQQKPTIGEKYQQLEKNIASLWQHS